MLKFMGLILIFNFFECRYPDSKKLVRGCFNMNIHHNNNPLKSKFFLKRRLYEIKNNKTRSLIGVITHFKNKNTVAT